LTAAVRGTEPEGHLREAEHDWEALMERLAKTKPETYALIEHDESGVSTAADVSLDMWLQIFQVRLRRDHYSRSDQTEPSF
jgi:hypothetical protein